MISPLKNKIYPRRAIGELKNRILSDSRTHTMWLYSGDLELALSAGGNQVTAHTPQPEVLNFWSQLSQVPTELYETLLSDSFRFQWQDYNLLQKTWHTWPSDRSRAALFFVLNLASKMGLPSRGTLDTTYLNAVSYSRILAFKKPLTLDFQLIETNPLSFAAETEDYIILNAGNYHYNHFDYGKAIGPEEVVIDHREIRARWAELSPRAILLYNYHPDLLALYKDSTIIMINEHGKPTHHEDMCKELIIDKQ